MNKSQKLKALTRLIDATCLHMPDSGSQDDAADIIDDYVSHFNDLDDHEMATLAIDSKAYIIECVISR